MVAIWTLALTDGLRQLSGFSLHHQVRESEFSWLSYLISFVAQVSNQNVVTELSTFETEKYFVVFNNKVLCSNENLIGFASVVPESRPRVVQPYECATLFSVYSKPEHCHQKAGS